MQSKDHVFVNTSTIRERNSDHDCTGELPETSVAFSSYTGSFDCGIIRERMIQLRSG